MKKSIKLVIAGLLMISAVFGTSLIASNAVSAENCSETTTNGIKTVDLTLQNGLNCTLKDDDSTTPKTIFGDGGIFTTIINVVLFVIGAISVVMLIFGGVRYTISGGEAKAVESAKNTILYAIIGLVIAILAFAIVNFVITSIK